MLERHHFWSFKNKDQRRSENELEKQHHRQSEKEHADQIDARTHLDLKGRKGFIGLARSMPAFFRHTRNDIYAKWVRGRTKPIVKEIT
jgi:hypothetical protein